jgi:hypothetical protein
MHAAGHGHALGRSAIPDVRDPLQICSTMVTPLVLIAAGRDVRH